jgi:heme-degrading monooxygenase HmoA
MHPFAHTPEPPFDPPYHAVIFTSTSSGDADGYAAAAARMIELASLQPGFLGVESASERGDGGVGITVSYWESEAAIAAWKAHAEHEEARNEGRVRWYDGYELRVAKVERAYRWRRTES